MQAMSLKPKSIARVSAFRLPHFFFFSIGGIIKKSRRCAETFLFVDPEGHDPTTFGL